MMWSSHSLEYYAAVKGVLATAPAQVEDMMPSDMDLTSQGWCHQTHRDRKWFREGPGQGRGWS